MIKCLTVKQPWTTAILELGKNIENRTWTTDYRGKLYIHASKKPCLDGMRFIAKLIVEDHNFHVDTKNVTLIHDILAKGKAGLIYGAIIGSIDLVDVTKNHSSVWAMPNQYHWVLENPKLLEKPIFCKGKLGLWDYEINQEQISPR